jgi:hypothetical protein
MGALRPTHTPQTQPISWFPSVSMAIRTLPLIGAAASQIRQFVSSTAYRDAVENSRRTMAGIERRLIATVARRALGGRAANGETFEVEDFRQAGGVHHLIAFCLNSSAVSCPTPPRGARLCRSAR